GDEVVGFTGLRRRGASSPVAENLLTAVRRTWRRRGIAVALKREQIARARAAGIEQIYTTNDESNAGMRGVHARLGYPPAPTQIVVSGDSLRDVRSPRQPRGERSERNHPGADGQQ